MCKVKFEMNINYSVHNSLLRNAQFQKTYRQYTYLSSCQKELASNSGNTRVAFITRAARTALHI